MSPNCEQAIAEEKGGTSVLIFRGRDVPLTEQYWPSFVLAGHGIGTTNISANFDYNGDGYSDMSLNTHGWTHEEHGGFLRFVKGRPYTGDGKIQVICSVDETLEGELGVENKLPSIPWAISTVTNATNL